MKHGTSALATRLLIAATFTAHPLAAQRIVPSKPWTPSVSEKTMIQLREGAVLSPRIAALAYGGRLHEGVLGFRADSLVLGLRSKDSAGIYRVTDSIAVAASVIETVLVRRHGLRQARVSTGGETAIYAGLAGALVGSLVAKRGHRATGAALGAGGGALLGFAYGAAHPYSGYADYWDEIKLRVER